MGEGLRFRHFAAEPGLRHAELAADGIGGEAKDGRGFFGGKASEETHFDQTCFGRVFSLQSLEGFVEGEKVVVSLLVG